MVEDGHQVAADTGVVVVDEAGGEDRHLARCGRAVPRRIRDARLRGVAKFPGVVRGQRSVLVHMQRLLHQLARGAVAGRAVGQLDHDRDSRQLAQRVGRGQDPVGAADLAILEVDCLGAQHQVRKVDVPGVRRHVRALGHVADVAQVALVDDFAEILLRDAVDLTGLALVDQVEQRRKRIAQAYAAAAAVADVEHALEFVLDLGGVVEIRVLPVQRMPGGCIQVAFAHGGELVVNDRIAATGP